MNEGFPGENMDQQFDDLPLPDENASWQKMKEMLDSDNDDGPIVPPVLLRSCLGWSILLLVGLTVTWLMVRPEQWWNETTRPKQSSSSTDVQKLKNNKEIEKRTDRSSKPLIKKQTKEVLDKFRKQKHFSIQPSTNYLNEGNNSIRAILKNKPAKPAAKVRTAENEGLNQKLPNTIPNNHLNKNNEKQITKQGNKTINSDTLTIANQQQSSVPKDSVKPGFIFQPTDSSIQKKTKSSEKKLIVSAGVGLQQQIPIAGQTTVPYSYYGRESSLADYIPSVFVTIQKQKKWFVMGEFRYGAAQSVKEFSYNQNTSFDSSSQNVTMTTMRLKKTYYHQLPFSFNYYLLTNLSVGVGGMYSRFHGAVTEKETDTWNVQTQTSTNFKEIIHIKHFTDSFLYKTQVHVLVQADYQWKRFSFGLRYTKDIQPYIKYTKPDGTIDEEKNQSLQLMIRYRIWQPVKL